MSADYSLWGYFADAGLIVKVVMLILLAASLLSWTIIVQRLLLFRQLKQSFKEFDSLFWSGSELTKLYNKLTLSQYVGIANVFKAGYSEFLKINKVPNHSANDMLAGIERAMRVASSRELEEIEKHLHLLASIGSTSPYIGLFGTVWGIMTAFHALGNVQHATIAMVAPGISEALVATAMGLFAAIPAVLAYNRFSTSAETFEQHMTSFQDEFTNLVSRQMNTTTTTAVPPVTL